MAKKKLIIEARVNEYMPRDENPNVPYTADEIAEAAAQCREAGAAIVHYHARNADGSPNHDTDVYLDTIRKIRDASDVLVHPTLGQCSAQGGFGIHAVARRGILDSAQDGFGIGAAQPWRHQAMNLA